MSPEGQLGFPRLTDIGPFVTQDIGWVLHPEVYDAVWTDISESEYLNFGPDPPVLIVHDNSSLDNELMHEQLFTRVPGEEYVDGFEWEKIPSRFSSHGGALVDIERAYTVKSLDLFPDAVKFQSQFYTDTGAMITFDFTQEYDEEVSGMMRAPATTDMLTQAKRAVEGLPHMEFFQLQERSESSQFSMDGLDVTDERTFKHPHYRSTGVSTIEEMIKTFEVLIEISEEYTRRRLDSLE